MTIAIHSRVPGSHPIASQLASAPWLTLADDAAHAEAIVAADPEELDRFRTSHPTRLRILVGAEAWLPERVGLQAQVQGVPEGLLHAHHLLCSTATAHDVSLVLRSREASETALTALPSKGRLPTLSTSTHELMKVLDDPDVSILAVKKVMEKDPSLVAKTLQIANSPLFQQRRTVSTLDRAIVLLGMANLRIAAMTAGFFAPIRGVRPEDVEAPRDAGLLAVHAVRTLTGAHAEVAETAALLMDVGQLLLLQFDPTYPALLQRAASEGCSLIALELEAYGTTHAEQGGRLLAAWGLPHDVCEAITLSHTPLPHPQRGFDTRALVYLASELTQAVTRGKPVPGHLRTLAPPGVLDTASEQLADQLLMPTRPERPNPLPQRPDTKEPPHEPPRHDRR